MSKKSYPTIDTSLRTLEILKLIGKSLKPTNPQMIVEKMDMKYATVMTHLITLERAGMIEEIEGGYIGSLELATFWAMRKALVIKKENDVNKEKEVLGIS